MRILHFFKTYWPDSFGGVERTIHALATGAQKRGATVEVLSLSRTPASNSVWFDGHRASKARLLADIASTGLSLDAIAAFREAAARADIVHYHYPWPYMDIAHFLVRHRKPCIVTYHSDVVRQKSVNRLYAPLRDRFLGAVDLVAATSPNYLATSPVLKRLEGKTCVIPLGLDESGYALPAEAELDAWRQRLGKPFFLFVGEFRYYKGLDVLLRAAGQTQADIVLVGEGRMGRSLQAMATGLGLRNVRFLGRLDDRDKAALLTLAAGFVFPSNQRSEAFGLSLVEASMFARPLVSCEIGTGTSFVNVDGETGIVVPPDDPAALAAAMNRIASDAGLRERFGAAARQRFERLFTADAMVDAYMEVYRRLLA